MYRSKKYGGTCMSGLNPFPVIEDGNFHIPVGSITKETFSEIETSFHLIRRNIMIHRENLFIWKRLREAARRFHF